MAAAVAEIDAGIRDFLAKRGGLRQKLNRGPAQRRPSMTDLFLAETWALGRAPATFCQDHASNHR